MKAPKRPHTEPDEVRGRGRKAFAFRHDEAARTHLTRLARAATPSALKGGGGESRRRDANHAASEGLGWWCTQRARPGS